MLSSATLWLLLVGPPGAVHSWETLAPYTRELVQSVLPAEGDVWTPSQISEFLKERGTRSAAYLAVGMLLRGSRGDAANGSAILNALLDLQQVAPGTRRHGVWHTSANPQSDRFDENWREFISMGLIMALDRFGEYLDEPQALLAAIERAAEGASARDVTPEYTNIALMSAFLLDYAGHRTGHPKWVDQAINKARAIFEGFSQYGTFSEYNSPTYYGVDLMALAFWRELGISPQLRDWGAQMEAALWREIATFYHASLRNLCGPYARAYGMDMTQYVALTGIWIALVLEDDSRAPVSMNRQQQTYEWAYVPMFAILGARVPEDARKHLRRFDESRAISRQVAYRGQVHAAQAQLEPTWMVGAATGMSRRWSQHCPATIHWALPEGTGIGWLLVHGESGVEARWTDGQLQVFMPAPDPNFPLRVLLKAPRVSAGDLSASRWQLPGLTLDVHTSLGAPEICEVADPRHGQVLEIAWSVNEETSPADPLVTFVPGHPSN